MPTTTKKRKISILITALLLTGAVIFFMTWRAREDDEHAGKIYLHVTSFKVDGGWGYDILAEEKIFIHQAEIPAVPGHRVFHSEDEALKTGRLVIYKVSHNLMPSVNPAELDSLGVSWKK